MTTKDEVTVAMESLVAQVTAYASTCSPPELVGILGQIVDGSLKQLGDVTVSHENARASAHANTLVVFLLLQRLDQSTGHSLDASPGFFEVMEGAYYEVNWAKMRAHGGLTS